MSQVEKGCVPGARCCSSPRRGNGRALSCCVKPTTLSAWMDTTEPREFRWWHLCCVTEETVQGGLVLCHLVVSEGRPDPLSLLLTAVTGIQGRVVVGTVYRRVHHSEQAPESLGEWPRLPTPGSGTGSSPGGVARRLLPLQDQVRSLGLLAEWGGHLGSRKISLGRCSGLLLPRVQNGAWRRDEASLFLGVDGGLGWG